MSTTESELSNIETFVLKVHMNCQGCINRVRKLLRKIEGVYKVQFNEEEQKVIVTGSVDPSTLVKKLVKSGKHAEIWEASSNQEQGNISVKDNQNNDQTQYVTNDPNASENHYITPTFFGTENHHWRPEWFLNQNMGTKAAESELDQNSTAPSFLENVENRGANYVGLGNQEWGSNLSGGSPISKYFRPLSLMSDIHGYYPSYQTSKLMHLNYHNCPPSGINNHMQEGRIIYE